MQLVLWESSRGVLVEWATRWRGQLLVSRKTGQVLFRCSTCPVRAALRHRGFTAVQCGQEGEDSELDAGGEG